MGVRELVGDLKGVKQVKRLRITNFVNVVIKLDKFMMKSSYV